MGENQKSNHLKKELNQLYKHLPEVKKLLRTFGCNKTIAEDIFQEALIIYLRKQEDKEFSFEREPIYYIKQTCKFLWMNIARKNQKQQAASVEMPTIDFSDDWMERELQYQQLENALSKIGEQCKQLLQMFYGLGQTMSNIAEKLGLRNAQTAKAQKYRCLQKAKQLVREEQALIVQTDK